MLPGKYVLPLVAPEDMDMQPPKGVLFVTLIGATDVRARATRPGGFVLSFCFLSSSVIFGRHTCAGEARTPRFSCPLAHACQAASKQPSAA